jgi:23S rRNA (uridine2552-2'-O)-methyltransferase
VRYERKDAHYRRAKAEGFRARSAYKLAELDDRHRLLRRGDRVADLGAWPGGWLQVAAERVGPSGRVVGIDLAEIEPLGVPNVDIVGGDLCDPAAIDDVRRRLGGLARVVLSDAAPKLTGNRLVDDARASELVSGVVDAFSSLLEPGGAALIKVFMNADYQATLARIRAAFVAVKTTRPDASRRGSAELYVIATGFRGAGVCG